MFDRSGGQRRVAATKEAAFPPPSKGWVQSGNLLEAPADGAELLDNFIPTAEGARLRGGTVKYADLGAPVKRLWTYNDSTGGTLMGSTQYGVYDVSRVGTVDTSSNKPIYLVSETGACILDEDSNHIIAGYGASFFESTGYTGTNSGDWSTTQLATGANTYLVAVNGTDYAWYYDGSEIIPITDETIYNLEFDAFGSLPAVGETATGGTSGATAEIHGVSMTSATAGILRLGAITGTFQDNEAVTTATGSVTSNIPSGTSTGSTVTITNVATSSLSQVWNFKERLFFVEKDSLSVWYLPVDSIGGAASEIDLGSVFSKGGKLLFGATWSLDSGSGMDDVCIFVTDQGQIAVYEGTNPASASTWALAGVYNIGTPLNKHAWFQAGGDLAILTKDGIIPVSEALRKDRAALQTVAITYPIEDEWKRVVANASTTFPITPTLWQAQTLLIIGVPDPQGMLDLAFVANSRTGAWARFTGWDVQCSAIANDELYIGGENGLVLKADTGGQDNVERFTPSDCGDFEEEDYANAYTASWVPKFQQFGQSGEKFLTHAGLTYLSKARQSFAIRGMQDYQIALPADPGPSYSPSGTVWGTGTWGTFVWGADTPQAVYSDWRTVSSGGYTVSAGISITSNQQTKIPFELVSMRVRYELGQSF